MTKEQIRLVAQIAVELNHPSVKEFVEGDIDDPQPIGAALGQLIGLGDIEECCRIVREAPDSEIDPELKGRVERKKIAFDAETEKVNRD